MVDQGDHFEAARQLTRSLLSVMLLTLVAAALVQGPMPSAHADVTCKKKDGYGRCVLWESDSDNGDSVPQEPDEGATWTEERWLQDCGNDKVGDRRSCASEGTCTQQGWYLFRVSQRDWVYRSGSWEVVNGWHDAIPLMQCRPGKHDQQVTQEQVRRAVVAFGLRAGEIRMDPPDQATLVQFESIFSTTQGAYPFHLEVDGVPVDLTATPIAYHWTFGEAGERTWDDKGLPYSTGTPESEYNTFTFTETGTYPVQLTIDYEVSWSITNSGDDWQTISQPIAGSADTQQIKVVETRDVLGHSK